MGRGGSQLSLAFLCHFLRPSISGIGQAGESLHVPCGPTEAGADGERQWTVHNTVVFWQGPCGKSVIIIELSGQHLGFRILGSIISDP